jgi:peptidoglycan hydrolase CwlO-like protein
MLTHYCHQQVLQLEDKVCELEVKVKASTDKLDEANAENASLRTMAKDLQIKLTMVRTGINP